MKYLLPALLSLYPALLPAGEAMQTWLGTRDTTAPQLTITESEAPAGGVLWTISTHEPIFQPHPFVAVKDRYERYRHMGIQVRRRTQRNEPLCLVRVRACRDRGVFQEDASYQMKLRLVAWWSTSDHERGTRIHRTDQRPITNTGYHMFLRQFSALFMLPLSLSLTSAQTLDLPSRAVDALSRDAILTLITPLPREAREDTLFRLVTSGNVPAFLRTLVPVTATATIGGAEHRLTYYVTPEYLAVGPDDRSFLAPMTPLLAQRIADALQCTLPTRKMVNDIYLAAPLKLAPSPIPPSAAMITVPVFAQHDSIVWSQRQPVLSAFPQGTLVGGTKKDVVISNKIRVDLKAGVPKPVVIYGWHQLNGTPIQPLYNGHGETYADYSHGIRLVQNVALLDGSPVTVSAILKANLLSALLSDEGAIAQPRYGDAPTGIDAGSDSSDQGSMIDGAFPNPFNTSTEIRFRLAATGVVTLKVYDLLGRETATLVDAATEPGDHEVTFDGSGLASGVYIVRFTAGRLVQSGKIVLVR